MQRLFMALIAGAIFIAGGTTLANTPKNTLVMAMNADDIISFDPAQVFELVGGEMIANIYDRVTMHEAEDLTALVGGAAESWEVSNNGHTITLKIRPNQ